MRLQSVTILWMFVVGFAMSTPTALHATSVIDVTFNDLVQQADLITVGTVTEVRNQYDAARKAPMTLVTVSKRTTLKGSSGESLTLEFLGGTLPNGLVMVIPGVPQFTVGEKVVAFSAGNKRDFCPLVGLWQGVMRVRTDPQRGIETVSDNFHVPVVKIQNGALVKQSAATGPRQQPMSLSTFLQNVEQALQTTGK